MNYYHLSQDERDRLAEGRYQGRSLRDVAKELGRSVSTLSRELRRNSRKPNWGARVYRAHQAQQKADERIRKSHRRPRLKNAALHQAIVERLEMRWSPELIAGRLKREHPEWPSISAEAIYQWLYGHRRDLIPMLARAHSKRWPRRSRYHDRKRIPGRISVRERPEAAQNRQEAGHWETDLVVGPGPVALQVLVERQTRYSRLRQVPQRTANASRVALTHLMDSIPKALRRSITYDNGSENAEHLTLNDDFDLQSYFCEPYHSWEKGTVENTNGLIRRFIPKRSDLKWFTEAQIQDIENWLNNRPRKILQFQTPGEVFDALLH
jgi:transposase, IS30 family